jgi:hypothetical protein
MPNTIWAEWIIARLSDRDRAASIIGDLLESGGERNPVWFWWSVAGVVVSLTWRGLVGLAVAYECLSVLNHAKGLAQCPQGRGSWFAVGYECPSSALVHQPPHVWVPIFAVIGFVSGLLCVIAPYAVVRYGFRDRFAQLTLALCAPSIVVGFYWWVPAVAFAYVVLVLTIISISGAFAYGRRALFVLAAALVCGYGGLELAPRLADWYLELASPSVIRTVIAHDSVPILWVAIAAMAIELMHRLLMRPSQH